MMEWLKSRRAGLLLLGLTVALGVSMKRSADTRSAAERILYDVVEVPVVAANTVLSTSSQWITELFRREQLHDQIGNLEARIAGLELDNQRLQEYGRENDRLGGLLALRQRAGLDGRAARVISADTVQGVRSLVIDAGDAVGVERNAPVVACDGLVGRVLKVGRNTSVVQLLVDGAAAVAAIDERSRVQGVVVGTGEGKLSLQYVPNPEDVEVGDRILASGLDGIYPKGALIGVVTEVSKGEDAFRVVSVAPASSPEMVETVFVVDRSSAVKPEGFIARLTAGPPSELVAP